MRARVPGTAAFLVLEDPALDLHTRQVERWLRECARLIGRKIRERPPKPRAPRKIIPAVELAKQRAADRELEERVALSHMRSAVWLWNVDQGGGRCDACGRPFKTYEEGDLDHYIERGRGGPDTRENGWRLCRKCHTEKSENYPTAEAWDRTRELYCDRAGIPFVRRTQS